jgi:hypothetical protein
MDSGDYEELVSVLAGRISSQWGLDVRIGTGLKNRIPGASGYSHQIDVSVTMGQDLALIECKCWSRGVGVDAVLVLHGRAEDIRATGRFGTVMPVLVSQKKPTAGALKLAAHFGIEIDVVRSAHEFTLRVFQTVGAGVTDSLVVRG